MGTMTLRVLMVCTGNICRSTMAQEVLSEQVAADRLDVLVDSAGISDEEHGNPIDPRAARVLREAGHRVPDHRARQVRAAELGSWDLVLAMTRQHLMALERLARRAGVDVEVDPPVGDHTVVDLRMFRSFDPRATGSARVPEAPDPWSGSALDVPDPWYGDHRDFEETLEVVEHVTPALVDHLRARLAPARP